MTRQWGVITEGGFEAVCADGLFARGVAQTEECEMLSLGVFRCRYPSLATGHTMMNVLKEQVGMYGEVGVVELLA